jgi:hypothetical protein
MHIIENDSGYKSARDRARICRSIHRRIILETVQGRNVRREVWARLVIGLPPIPRQTIDWRRYQ